jgi:predicted amidohydrolase
MAKVAVIQMAVDDGDWQANLRRAVSAIESAPEADIYLLPELWTSGYLYDAWRGIAQDATPRVVETLSGLARKRGAAIGGTMISLNETGNLVNRLWYISPDDTVCYDKMHLFPPLNEPSLLSPGRERVVTETAGIRLALSICFDLRFPTMYRRDALDGAQAFVVPSEWPASRADALRTFCRARAMENQAYLILCNRTGVASDGLAFSGGSAVISPTGEILGELADEEGVITAEIDGRVVDELRQSFPVLSMETADA